MSIVLIRLNKPNLNHRIYEEKSFPKQLPSMIPLLSEPQNWSTLHGVAENLRIDKGFLVADLKFTDKGMGYLFQNRKITYVSSGFGEVGRNEIVKEFSLEAALATQHEETIKFMNEMQYLYDIRQ